MAPSTASGSVYFYVETVMEIVLFTIMIAVYTYVWKRLAVEYNRFIYWGADGEYVFTLNRRTWAGIVLFCLSILEILHVALAFFIPALSVPGQMKIFGLAIFILFAVVLATWVFGAYLIFHQCKQTNAEVETDLELLEIVVPTEEEPTEVLQILDDSLDLD